MTISVQQSLMQHFNEIDTNGDNFLTIDEVKAYAKQKMTAENAGAVIGCDLLASNKGAFDEAEVAQYHGTPDGRIGYGDLQALDATLNQMNAQADGGLQQDNTGQKPETSSSSSSFGSGISDMLKQMKDMVNGSATALFTMMNNTANKMFDLFSSLKLW